MRYLVLTLFLCGCGAIRKQPQIIAEALPVMSPIPKSIAQKSIQPKTLIVMPLPTITWIWNKGEPGSLTEIWSKTNLINDIWRLKASTLGNNITFLNTNQQEYFILRNFRNGDYSTWNIK
jgi:hypothetical protein